ncbi:hypothetical protein LSH36_1825g00000, partial [Paralvinella palmiformis]
IDTSDPVPCDSNNCLNGGTCFCDNRGYRCNCMPTFTGKNCETGTGQYCEN